MSNEEIIKKAIERIASIYPTVNLYDEPVERMAGAIIRALSPQPSTDNLTALHTILERETELDRSDYDHDKVCALDDALTEAHELVGKMITEAEEAPAPEQSDGLEARLERLAKEWDYVELSRSANVKRGAHDVWRANIYTSLSDAITDADHEEEGSGATPLEAVAELERKIGGTE